jgi:hypothetical protein
MEARNRVGIGLYYGPAGATWAGGIDSLGSIPVLDFKTIYGGARNRVGIGLSYRPARLT